MHYGDIGNRLSMRGIDEPGKDLETLKQILEALQLKGLLHSKPSDHGATGRRIRIYDNQGPDRLHEADLQASTAAIKRAAAAQIRRRSSECSASPLRADLLPVRSPRRRRPTANASPMERVHPPAEDDASTTRSGRSLLERCDKLLQGIAAFTEAEQDTAADQQPSPVSVVDSSSYLGEEGSPWPLAKRSIDFKEEPWSTYEVGEIGAPVAMDPDYAYVCDVLRASERYGDASDAAYAALENGRCRRRGGPARYPSKTARLHRRLVFDAVAEILDCKHHVSLWDVFARGDGEEGEKALPRVWAEFQRLREQVAAADDHEGAACGAVRNDIAAVRPDGWVRPAAEMSDVVLEIERLIFKDLVAETIRDLGAREPLPLHHRKLVF
ncbi:unnamed protein product [Musa hybrid cultivar]